MFSGLASFLRRFSDFVSLCVSQILTLGGLLEFTSVDELVNQRKPARWMRWSKRKQLLNQFNGGFLLDGKVGRLSEQASFQSIVTTGGMGVGKSANLILPNLLTASNCSLVVTDTSGELFEQSAGALAARGFEIQVFNLMDPTRSHRFNPLAAVRNYSDAEQIAHILVHARGGQTNEPFWDDGAKRLLRILIRTLKNTPQASTASLVDVLYWLNKFDAHLPASEGGRQLDAFVAENTLTDTGTFEDYRGFVTNATDKILLSFVATASTALSMVGNTDIAQLLRGHDFDFDALKQRKIALFVMVRQQDMAAFGFLLSLFYSQICDALLKNRSGGLPVWMLLDEFGHLDIPGFPVFAGTARKFGVGFWLILQSLAQLETHYGSAGARTILSSVGTESYFGGMDLSTAQNLSGRLGPTQSMNWYNPSAGPKEKDLMRPDELIRLKENQMLVLHGNLDPLKITTAPFYKRGDLRNFAKMQPPPLPQTHPLREGANHA